MLGGTGKTGQKVVEALLAAGREVVVAERTKGAAEGLFGAGIPGLFIVQVVSRGSLKRRKGRGGGDKGRRMERRRGGGGGGGGGVDSSDSGHASLEGCT